MTIQEMQTLIDNKDWTALRADKIIFKHLKNHDKVLDLMTFSSEFVTEFFCSKENYQVFRDEWFDDITLSLISQCRTLTLDEYEVLFKFLIAAKHEGLNYYSTARSHMAGNSADIRPRPTGYFDLLLKYNEALEINWYGYKPTTEDLDNMTDASKAILQDRISDTTDSAPFNQMSAKMMLMFTSKEDYLERLTQQTSRYSSSDRRIREMREFYTTDEILRFMEVKGGFVAKSIQEFFVSDVELTDELLEKIIDISNTKEFYLLESFVRLLTVEQYKTARYTETKISILLCKDATLKDFAENSTPDEQQRWASSIIGTRYFRDEEMADYPNMFDPRSVRRGYMYCSRETFKLLNRTWGKRQKYNEDLEDFAHVVRGAYREKFTIDDVVYVMDKTKASNEEVVKFLAKNQNYIENYYEENLKSLAPLSRFFDDEV